MDALLRKICNLCGDIESDLSIIGLNNLSCYKEEIRKYLDIEINSLLLSETAQMCVSCREKITKWDAYVKHVLSVQQILRSLSEITFTVDNELEKDFLKYISGSSFCSRKLKRKRRRNEKLNLTSEIDDVFIPSKNDDLENDSQIKPLRLKIKKINNDSPKVESIEESSDKENDDESNDDPTESQESVINDIQITDDPDVASDSNNSTFNDPSENRIRWDCSKCKLNTSSWIALKKHCLEIHKSGPTFICGCTKILQNRASIIKHHIKHTVGLQYKCDKCDKSYHIKRLLEMHLLSHVPKEEQPWLCCKCCRRFHSETLLKQHEKMHLPPDRKLSFPCEYCQKKMCSKAVLAVHVKAVHLGERPFICDQCGNSFASKGILDEHIKIHSDIYNHQCQECGKSFKSKYRLRIHIDTHLETRYECTICGLSLNTRRTLRMHLLVHEDRKSFHCSTCGKAFRRSKDLKNHINLHTGRKPYSCPFCSRTFANGSNCRSHKRRMHPEELRLYEEAIATGTQTQYKLSNEVVNNGDAVISRPDCLLPSFKNPEAVKVEEELDVMMTNFGLAANLNLHYSASSSSYTITGYQKNYQ